MTIARLLTIFLTLISLQACGTYSTSSITDAPNARAQGNAHKTPDQIQISQSDILDRKYVSLGDISVTVRKTTIFDKDPTQNSVNQALQEKASDMGADAVILVRYGKEGVGLMSWGQMDGNGRAVVFQ